MHRTISPGAQRVAAGMQFTFPGIPMIISGDEELTTLYIGNLNYKVNENVIKAHFEQYGYVDSVRLMKDRKTGRRKGFGFVEVDAASADKMITKLNDSTFEERTLRVRLAKEKSED